MGISALSGLPSQTISSIYSKQGDSGKYSLKPQKRNAKIEELELELKEGKISESEFKKEKAALESAPISIYTTPNQSKIKSDNIFQTNPNEKEVEKLKQQLANGEISNFEYRANMYMLTTPTAENSTSNFSAIA